MTNVPESTVAAVSPMSKMTIPPQMMMWAGMYAVMFTIAGGMIAYMYNRT